MDLKGFFYHVISRGQRKNPIFFSRKDYDKFIKILNNVLAEMDIELFAFCLMRNHFHLLVRRNDTHLHHFMKLLNTRYAVYFNHEYGCVGHVFQDRYKSFIVMSERYLSYLKEYIHNNPLRKGMVEKAEQYRYSSAAYYAKGNYAYSKLQLLDLNDHPGYDDRIDPSYQIFGIPESNGVMGSFEEFIVLEKRLSGRESGKYIERRKQFTKPLEKMLEVMIEERGYSIEDLKMLRWNREFKKDLIPIIKTLVRLGYGRSDISKVLGRSRGWINYLLKTEKS